MISRENELELRTTVPFEPLSMKTTRIANEIGRCNRILAVLGGRIPVRTTSCVFLATILVSVPPTKQIHVVGITEWSRPL